MKLKPKYIALAAGGILLGGLSGLNFLIPVALIGAVYLDTREKSREKHKTP